MSQDRKAEFGKHSLYVVAHAAYGKFVKQDSFSPSGWRTPQADTLWNSGTENSPVKTVNDPCPCGWRVPTPEELNSLFVFKDGLLINSEEGELNGVFGRFIGSGENSIFLPAAGLRSFSVPCCDGKSGQYWTSSPFRSTEACFIRSTYDPTIPLNGSRAFGYSIRCVAEKSEL